MTYRQFKPHPLLASYIDTYWTVTGDEGVRGSAKILPDGCVDIIFNLGEDCATGDSDLMMKNAKAYLVGTMTRFKEIMIQPSASLLGIRFRPAAFPVFYKYISLHEVTDRTIEFEGSLAPDLKKMMQYPIGYLNDFFLARLNAPRHTLSCVAEDIEEHKGRIGVETLAKRHFTTARQLERHFKQHVGTSPKEFINLVRYQAALRNIRNNYSERSLLDIALECGYYDHSHLANEVKKYTGVAPSSI